MNSLVVVEIEARTEISVYNMRFGLLFRRVNIDFRLLSQYRINFFGTKNRYFNINIHFKEKDYLKTYSFLVCEKEGQTYERFQICNVCKVGKKIPQTKVS